MIPEGRVFEPCCLSTGLGSLPPMRAEEAWSLIRKYYPAIPYWPQFPKKAFHENMCIQFSQGLPSISLDEEGKRLSYDPASFKVEELESFYEHWENKEYSPFSLEKEYSEGFAYVLERLKAFDEFPEKPQFLKGQVVGPVTFGLTVKSKEDMCVLYDEFMADVITKAMAMKACYQAKRFRELGYTPMIFFDEPSLCTIGTPQGGLKPETVLEMLNEVFDAVKGVGAIVGLHCCGNTDWSLLLSSRADVLSFDAFGYLDKVACYCHDISAFLERGGSLAFGIVPTFNLPEDMTFEAMKQRLEEGLDLLCVKGLNRDLLLRRCLITPSCGLGFLSIPEAERVMTLCHELSQWMRERYF